jgi:Putative zinc-finger
MFNVPRHASDDEILRYIDRELSEKRTRRLRDHLATCAQCKERQASIEAKSGSLDNFFQDEFANSYSTTAAASRDNLGAKLAEAGGSHTTWRVKEPPIHFRFPVAAATTILIAALGFYAGERVLNSSPAAWVFTPRIIIPNHSLTPGAVRPVILSEICSSEDGDLDPTVPEPTENAVLREYGLTSGPAIAQKYQIDYLVNPQLGGTNDIKNLWPQPYSNGAWNAHAKDVLERHLHQMVCSRTVDLATAQRAIEVDWIAAYKKYVGREGS